MARVARRPVVDFGVHAARIVKEARAEGLTWDEAWQRVTSTIRPADTGWGPLDLSGVGAEGLETPMQTTYRALREAYGR